MKVMKVNHVKRRVISPLLHALLLVLIPLIFSSCASAPYKVTYSGQAPLTKFPVTVFLKLPDEHLDKEKYLATSGCQDIEAPFTSIFNETLKLAFSQLFENVITTGKPSDQQLNIVATLDSIRSLTWDVTTSRNVGLAVSGSMKLLNPDGTDFWTVPTKESQFTTYVFGPLEPDWMPKTTNKAMASLAEKWVREISALQPLHQLAKSATGSDLARELMDIPKIDRVASANSFAVVVGIEKYRDIQKADFAERDALAVRKYLVNLLGYPEENIAMLTNEKATRSDLGKYVGEWLRNRVDKESKVFFYFAGHGAPDPVSGESYLVPFDGDPNYLQATALPLRTLFSSLSTLKTRQVVAVLDSCFSGSGGRSVLARGARPLVMQENSQPVIEPNMAVIAAADKNQISISYDKAMHGLFTYNFLKALKSDLVGNNGRARLVDIFDALSAEVRRSARLQNIEQRPVLLTSSEAPKSFTLK